MKAVTKSFSTLILCALAASHAMAQDLKIKPGVVKGAALISDNARNYEFCEFYVGSGPINANTPLEGYNSTGTSTGCPASTFSTLEPKKLASDIGASIVLLNPPRPNAQKWWVVDKLHAFAAGETFDFSGIKAIWVVKMTVGDLEAAAKSSKTPYQPLTNRQLSTWTFNKGNQVYLLRAPEGKVYVMQAYTNVEDPSLTYEQLPQLASKLQKLPAGWKYEVKTLDKDLVFDVRKATPSGLKHLTSDELGDIYLGCGFDKACNYMP
jgi:hypothetical protein